jgi:hypothetical protein
VDDGGNPIVKRVNVTASMSDRGMSEGMVPGWKLCIYIYCNYFIPQWPLLAQAETAQSEVVALLSFLTADPARAQPRIGGS